MKLLTYFDSFLKTTVNLNQSRLDDLELRVQSIVVALGLDEEVGPRLVRHIPQGSWAHRTIIKPLPGDEFDADILIQLTVEPAWSEDPKEYLKAVRAAFRRTATYRDMVRKKNRCVRIGYANDCHVDVVPYLNLDDDREVIINYAENAFEDTNPDGFTDWMKEKDDLARGNLRKVIRLLKYIRDRKNTFSVPSVILTTLVGERVLAWDAASRYSDVPSTLVQILEDLAAWLGPLELMPVIADPSCPGTTFNHRWDQDRYANFRTQITRYARWAREAYDEPDIARSVVAWQRVFGDAFVAPPKAAATSEVVLVKAAAPPERAPEEQFIEELVAARELGHTARIEATVLQRVNGFRRGRMQRGQVISKHNRLRFELVTDVPLPFQVYWKVRNHGDEARRLGQLRGQIVAGTKLHEESTLYRGRHFIEVFVVKDRRLMAQARLPVDIA